MSRATGGRRTRLVDLPAGALLYAHALDRVTATSHSIDMVRRSSIAFPLAALVLVAWFLWPFESIAQDPQGAALAALRAIMLFAVTVGTTNVVADLSRDKHSPLLRVLLGFSLAWTIIATVSIALDLIELSADPFLWRPLLLAATLDAAWCAAAIGIYNLLSGRVPAKSITD